MSNIFLQKAKSEALGDVFAAHNFIWSQHTNKAKKYLTDYGWVIGRNYRQRGLAGEFLKARNALAKLLGVGVTCSLFTAVASQKAAEKIGYKVTFEFSFEELGRKFPAFNFANAGASHAKIMEFIVD